MSFELYRTKILFKWRSFIDFLRSAFRYYKNPLFRKIDLALLRSYLFENPYRLSRDYLKSQHASEIYAYGETPLTTMEMMIQACHLKEGDKIYELGSGRGRVCFWLAVYLNFDVIGIDFVPRFIEKAEAIKERFHLKNLEFRCENFLESSFDGASLIYLHGTCLADGEIEALIKKLNQLKGTTQVITVSFALNEYLGGEKWVIQKSFSAPFSWGDAEVYIQKRLT